VKSHKIGENLCSDVRTSCPQDPNGYPETNGYPTCASFTAGPDQLTLAQLGSNNVVAIDMDVLKNNRANLCGKAITVTANGQTVCHTCKHGHIPPC
jgi:hypothetical protein